MNMELEKYTEDCSSIFNVIENLDRIREDYQKALSDQRRILEETLKKRYIGKWIEAYYNMNSYVVPKPSEEKTIVYVKIIDVASGYSNDIRIKYSHVLSKSNSLEFVVNRPMSVKSFNITAKELLSLRVLEESEIIKMFKQWLEKR